MLLGLRYKGWFGEHVSLIISVPTAPYKEYFFCNKPRMNYIDNTSGKGSDNGTPSTGIGSTAGALVTAFHLSTCLPVGRQMQLDGHVALYKDDELVDINFGPAQLADLKQRRTYEHSVFGDRYLQMYNCVPLEQMRLENVAFRAEATVDNFSDRQFAWHYKLFKTLERDQLPRLQRMLEQVPYCCTPTAVVKKMITPSLTLKIGQLGFKDESGELSDVEFGADGFQWK
jgi:hypothetical protein